MTPRQSVQNFAQEMERKLRDNEHKGNWLNTDLLDMLDKLTEEKQELVRAVKKHNANYYSPNQPIDKNIMQQVTDEAADVANIAMMVADIVRYKCQKS